MLLVFSLMVIIGGIVVLAITEGAADVHGQTRFQILDIGFEVVSAFATVGLSTGLTPELSSPGKLLVSALMFIGRLGPIWLITMLRSFQEDVSYRLPETFIPTG